MSANPLGTTLLAYLASLNASSAGTPAQLAGFISRGGDIKAWPGDDVPYTGAIAAASEDGSSGIKPAANNGDNVKILADLYGRLWVVQGPQLEDATTAPAGELERELPGKHVLVEYAGLNLDAATMYLMVFDSATIPANGTVPRLTGLPVATMQFGSIALDGGVIFTDGISVAFSSTPLTLTKTTTNSSYTIGYR